MKSFFFSILLLPSFFSCKKENINPPVFTEALYTITLTGKWTTPEFTVPAGVHFTAFIGMVHNGQTSLWKTGSAASPGTERLAEIGDGSVLLSEIDSVIAVRQASSLIVIAGPAATGSRTASIYCNTNYSSVSFASMLAPSPDWFVGINSINLNPGNKWISDTIVNLYPHDAGTEEGDVFGYNNPATIPQQNIHLLPASQATVLANGNPVLAPIATARFTLR